MVRGESGTSSSTGTLKLKKKRKLQAWQAYHALTYESKWKPIINSEYTQYVMDWTSTGPEHLSPMSRFAFMNNFMREKYAAETDIVKAEVEEYRQSEKGDQTRGRLNLTFQEYVCS